MNKSKKITILFPIFLFLIVMFFIFLFLLLFLFPFYFIPSSYRNFSYPTVSSSQKISQTTTKNNEAIFKLKKENYQKEIDLSSLLYFRNLQNTKTKNKIIAFFKKNNIFFDNLNNNQIKALEKLIYQFKQISNTSILDSDFQIKISKLR